MKVYRIYWALILAWSLFMFFVSLVGPDAAWWTVLFIVVAMVSTTMLVWPWHKKTEEPKRSKE